MIKKLMRLFKNEYKSNNDKKSIFADNSGSALILVIVVVGFVTVLTSIVVSSAMVNHKVRSIDRRTKDDFYYAEKALEDIYTGIGQDCSVAMAEAYSEVAEGNAAKAYSFKSQEAAYAEYKKQYLNRVYTRIYDDLGSYVTENSGHSISVTFDHTNKKLLCKEDGTLIDSVPADYDYKEAKFVKLNHVVITCEEDSTGYISTISTDIVIGVPDAHFFTVQESPLNYAIIANKGIEFEGNGTNGGISVNGSIYAGYDKDSQTAINVDSDAKVVLVGDCIAARGDIAVNENAKLEIGSDGVGSRVWFENLKLKSGSELNAKNRTSMFALGDLEVNGNNCKAKLGGAYYGYNNEALIHKNEDGTEQIAKAREYSNNPNSEKVNALSSSIIINGNNANVDVSTLQTLLLMGRAYVDFNNGKEYPTGEGFALKTNQEIYLVPQEFIKDGYTNPAPGTVDFSGHISIPDGTDGVTNKWFGYDYLVDGSEPKFKTVTVNNRTYAYLNLKNPGEYFEKIASAVYASTDNVSPTAFELKKKMEGSTANDIFSFNGLEFRNGANIYIHNGAYRNGAVGFKNGYIYNSSNLGIGAFADYPEALYSRYRDLCINLNTHDDRSLSSNGDILSDEDEADWVNNEPDYPALKYVSFDAKDNDGSSDDFVVDNLVYGSVNVADSSTVISSDGKQFWFVNGDVTIEPIELNGMIIATGKVTIKDGAKINSDNSLLQKRIDMELKNARSAIAGGTITNKADVYKKDYIISYLLDYKTGNKLYDYTNDDYDEAVKEVTQSVSTDYTQYVTLDNWKKGE